MYKKIKVNILENQTNCELIKSKRFKSRRKDWPQTTFVAYVGTKDQHQNFDNENDALSIDAHEKEVLELLVAKKSKFVDCVQLIKCTSC